MKTTKFQRITALILTVVMLLCGGIVSVGAQETAPSTDTALEHIKEMLNAQSYKEYIEANAAVSNADKVISVDATKKYTYVTGAGVTYTPDTVIGEDVAKENIAYVDKFDGRDAVYTPSSGTITWKVDGIETAARYNIQIVYYPIENKSASIEREFMINGKVPFSRRH